ncbi:RDD family protein [Endozoicomonas ascidiicola]|uniref:RDD family protein n=1 Tax=Endozoicomonas ascidiicola TaxID=1698521 RepID=UPI00082C5C06|nr:RDD family protein [Endozoicomonas ascidiicola]
MDAINVTPAPLWRRVASMLYDSFLILALFFLVGFINLFIQIQIYGNEQLRQMTAEGYNLGGPFFYSTLLVLTYGFYGFFWTRNGQTLGMLAWRIKVVSEHNQLISPGQSLLRFIVAIPSLLLGGIGLAWAILDKDKRSWQDMASRSKVILLPKKAKQ